MLRNQLCHRFHIQRMFDGMHPGFQLFWIAPQILESPLGDDPAPVELSVHIVDRHTEDLDAVSKGIGNGMRPPLNAGNSEG